MNNIESWDFSFSNLKRYEVEKNKEFLEFYQKSIENGYKPSMSLEEIQKFIDLACAWYEFKYPEKYFEHYENGTGNTNINCITSELDFEQLKYRLNDNEIDLVSCLYKSSYASPKIENESMRKMLGTIGFRYIYIPISIKKLKTAGIKQSLRKQLAEFPYFIITADEKTGIVNKDVELTAYVDKENMTLEDVLNEFEHSYKDQLSYEELRKTVIKHKIDLEFRDKIFKMISLKLIYSKTTTPKRGYERAARFLSETSSKVKNLHMSMSDIDEIIDEDYDAWVASRNQNVKKISR